MTTDANGPYLQDVLERAIAFPSPLTELGEAEPQVLAFLSEFLAPEMRSLQFDVQLDQMGNVLGSIEGAQRDGKPLLIVVFAMTHPAATMPDPYTPKVVDGADFGAEGLVVLGRGAGEQKGPLAAVLTTFHSLKTKGARPMNDVFLLGLASGETGRHDAIRFALDHFQLQAGGAIIAVCAGNDIVVGHKGRIDVRVLIKGKASHSSSPWLGVNALEGARVVLERVADLDLGEPDPALGPRSVTPTALETRPKASHTVPAEAELTLDWRLLPGDTPEWAIGHLREVLADIEPWQIEVEPGDYMLASDVSEDSEIVKSLTEAIRGVAGRDPELMRISAATDTGYLNNRGIPAVLFGPGDIARAHTDEDLLVLEEGLASAAILEELIT